MCFSKNMTGNKLHAHTIKLCHHCKPKKLKEIYSCFVLHRLTGQRIFIIQAFSVQNLKKKFRPVFFKNSSDILLFSKLLLVNVVISGAFIGQPRTRYKRSQSLIQYSYKIVSRLSHASVIGFTLIRANAMAFRPEQELTQKTKTLLCVLYA